MSLEDLRWKKYQVGSDGFICLVDWMGDDSSVVNAARISYGKGTRQVSDDKHLIRYLYRMSHSSPFEHCEFSFYVRVDCATWRQWIRHRLANINEYSMRYSEAIDSCSTTDPEEWRLQSTTNKQGSGNTLTDWPEGFEIPQYIDETIREQLQRGSPGDYLTWREGTVHKVTREIYDERLTFGVAREQARKDLPLSNYTEAYWKIDLLNLLKFLSLRMDKHAQLEIRQYANAMYEIVKQICPLSVEAFDDYDFRRGGLLLSKLDLDVLQKLRELEHYYGFVLPCDPDFNFTGPGRKGIVDEACASVGWTDKSREKQEFLTKMLRMKISTE